MEEHPVIVIGAGTAGSQAARTLGRAGRRVVVVENDAAGGTCLWRGCVPKKALYAAGSLLRQIGGAGAMGIGALGDTPGEEGPGRPRPRGQYRLDWARTRAWQTEVMGTYAGDQERILRDAGVELAHGTGRFVAPDTVEIDGVARRGEHIVIAAGSRSVLPPVPGGHLMDTSDDALFYDELPATLVVVGGGYIAMELSAVYASFGARVHILVRGDRVLKGFDPECAQVALDGLRELGVEVRLRTRLVEVRGARGALTVVAVNDEGSERVFATERALAATGRRAALGGVQLTPVAGYEGRRVAQDILDAEASAAVSQGERSAPARSGDGSPPVIPSTCFTVPEVSRVGLLESELAARGVPYKVARGGFEYTAQAIIRGQRRGLVKLLFDDGDRLVGAHLAGPSAGELVYALSLAVQARATVADMQSAKAVHPTLAEAISWAASSPETIEPEAAPHE